jgi:hypothetical protein
MSRDPNLRLPLDIEAALLRAAASVPGAGPLPVVVASDAYADLLDNWLRHINLLAPDRFLIVAMDGVLEAKLLARGLPVGRADFDGTPTDFWLQRILVWESLVRSGLDIIQSDVDAIWMRDPRDMLSTVCSADLLFSQGTLHPWDGYSLWSFVLCTGFFLIRAGEAANRLFDAWLANPVRLRETDDQAELNTFLVDAGIRWNLAGLESYQEQLQDLPFKCFRDTLVGDCPSLGFRVAMLPHHLFPRLANPGSDAYVRHVLRPADDALRILQLKAAGCWIDSRQ